MGWWWGGWRVPLHVYALRLDSPDQRSSPLSCFSEPRKAYKSSRWPEQMVPVSGPVAQPENRLHLLGQHEGWRNWFTSLITSTGGNASLCLYAHPSEGSLLCNYSKYGSRCTTQKERFEFQIKSRVTMWPLIETLALCVSHPHQKADQAFLLFPVFNKRCSLGLLHKESSPFL